MEDIETRGDNKDLAGLAGYEPSGSVIGCSESSDNNNKINCTGDIGHPKQSNITRTQCRDACDNNKDCKSWTWYEDNDETGSYHCKLTDSYLLHPSNNAKQYSAAKRGGNLRNVSPDKQDKGIGSSDLIFMDKGLYIPPGKGNIDDSTTSSDKDYGKGKAKYTIEAFLERIQ